MTNSSRNLRQSGLFQFPGTGCDYGGRVIRVAEQEGTTRHPLFVHSKSSYSASDPLLRFAFCILRSSPATMLCL